jgi:hypothetical protein
MLRSREQALPNTYMSHAAHAIDCAGSGVVTTAVHGLPANQVVVRIAHIRKRTSGRVEIVPSGIESRPFV